MHDLGNITCEKLKRYSKKFEGYQEDLLRHQALLEAPGPSSVDLNGDDSPSLELPRPDESAKGHQTCLEQQASHQERLRTLQMAVREARDAAI